MIEALLYFGIAIVMYVLTLYRFNIFQECSPEHFFDIFITLFGGITIGIWNTVIINNILNKSNVINGIELELLAVLITIIMILSLLMFYFFNKKLFVGFFHLLAETTMSLSLTTLVTGFINMLIFFDDSELVENAFREFSIYVLGEAVLFVALAYFLYNLSLELHTSKK